MERRHSELGRGEGHEKTKKNKEEVREGILHKVGVD